MARTKQQGRKRKNKDKSAPTNNTHTPSKYIDPNFGDATCQGGEKSSLFWLKDIPAVYPDLLPDDKKLFVKDMVSQVYGSLHKSYHKEIWSLLFNLSKDDKSICNRISQLRKSYIMKNKTFICTCGSEINQEVLGNIKNLEKDANIPPQKKQRGDTWVNIVDPHFEDTTCEGADKSSIFWIGKIAEDFSNLSNQKKMKFMENMKSQAHACLHKDYHKTIVAALKAGLGGIQNFLINRRIPELEKKYDEVNMKFVCTCGLELSDNIIEGRKAQESSVNQDSPGKEYCGNQVFPATKEKDEIGFKPKEPWKSIVNPYLGDTTCEGSEKSSLFWLGKIREDYSNLGNKKKIKFVQDMISQVHACLHKDFHTTIIAELKAGVGAGPPCGPKKLNYLCNHVIPNLEIVYHNKNMKFECTCDSRLTDETLQTEKAASSCEI